MLNPTEIIKFGQETIQSELDNLKNLSQFIDGDFASVVNQILSSDGRVVISGIGKSAIIAQKIVATMNSTGTPSIFMHAADAIHGDLGIIQKNDTVIIISKSGNTPEIKTLVPLIKRFGNNLVAMVGNLNSYLALNANYVLNTTVAKEACPNNLAPTTSTTAQLLMGDALAVALLSSKKFTSNDFSKYHPGGALGKQLYLTVKEMALQNEKPSVQSNDSIKDTVIEISKNRLGASAVIENDKVIGIVTDGDIRRHLEKSSQLENVFASDIMTKNPISIESDQMASDAALLMKKNKINQLIVTENQAYIGMVHLQDFYREGIL